MQKNEIKREIDEERNKIFATKKLEEDIIKKEINEVYDVINSLDEEYAKEKKERKYIVLNEIRERIFKEFKKLSKLQIVDERRIKNNIKELKEDYEIYYLKGNFEVAKLMKKLIDASKKQLETLHIDIKEIVNRNILYVGDEIKNQKDEFKKALIIGDRNKIIAVNKKIVQEKINLHKLHKIIENMDEETKYKIKRELHRMTKEIQKLNEQQNNYILEKNHKKVKEIDLKIISKKDKIQKLIVGSVNIEKEQVKHKINYINELNKKISLLEVEYEVVKKYKNTYRMNEIKDEIINKKFKIQNIKDEIVVLQKERALEMDQQIESIKKYIAELEEENLNNVFEANLVVFKKNEENIKNSNKQMFDLNEKIKLGVKQQIEKYNDEISFISKKLLDLERAYRMSKNSLLVKKTSKDKNR
jgi:hypothetical protein